MARSKKGRELGLPRSLPRHSQVTCSGCLKAHLQPQPHNRPAEIPPPGHTLVTDICGALQKSPDGFKFFMTVTELHTRMSMVFLLKTRSAAGNTIISAAETRHFGVAPARIRCDNAPEFLTKDVLRHFAAVATHVDPTVPHTPQDNSIAERLNQTLINRVRATLITAQLPFRKYWQTCLLDTVSKASGTYHSTIEDIPRARWNRLSTEYSPFPNLPLDLRLFRNFGEYGYIPNRKAIKTKADHRGTLVRYLFMHFPTKYTVLIPHSGQFTTTRIRDFKPYNPNFDPQHRYYHALPPTETVSPKANLHHMIPKFAMATTPKLFSTDRPNASAIYPSPINLEIPPRGLINATKHIDSAAWQQAFEKELRAHQHFQTFKPLPRATLHKSTKIPSLVLTFSYKYHPDGTVK